MPKTAYLIDSIGFMFTKCQNRKSFIYNKLRDFRESLDSMQFVNTAVKSCNFAHWAVGIFALYVAVSHGGAWEPLAVNFAENERWGLRSGIDEPL